MPRQRCFLVCNAHLDPVWLWPWEDGMTETISTYRVAADFCDQHPGFVFNHNESLLYEWVEEHDPALFERIRAHVRAGRWHIAGGAYLQPDPIGTTGESMIRQYLVGKRYFASRFGVEPTTAYNFDSFGHPRGMVQILAGCGFDAYVFCRPNRFQQDLPVGAFRWRHHSGAEIIGRRSDDHYITQGQIRREMRDGAWPAFYAAEGDFMFLWGLGNHGGGPSRAEYAQFADMRADHPEVEFVESTPEAFFAHTLARHPRATLPVHGGDLQPLHEGCYTSMIRVKQAHRRLENLIAQTERLAAMAWWRGRRDYPAVALHDAWKDILFAEFHDILPGSGIPSVETDCLARLGHAEEILRRQRAGAMISLLRDEPKAELTQTPVFVFNPHSWPVTQEVEIEYCLDRQYRMHQVERSVACDGRPIAAQFEKAEHNLANAHWGEWRRKAVFTATVPPLSFRRFDTSYRVLPDDGIRPWTTPAQPANGRLEIAAGTLRVAIDLRSGLIDAVSAEGRPVLAAGSGRPVVLADKAHAWEIPPAWQEPIAVFRLATPAESARIRGSERTNPRFADGLPPVAVIEDGPLRTIVEAVFVHEGSYVVQRYVVHRTRPLIHLEQDIFWDQHDRLLGIDLRHAPGLDRIHTERMYSVDDRSATAADGSAHDAQRFVRVGGPDLAFAAVPYGTSGFAHRDATLRLHILRSPPYSGMDDVPPGDDRFHHRYIVRQDQGLRSCRHSLLFAGLAGDLSVLVRTARELHQPLSPFVYFPTGAGGAPATATAPLVSIDAEHVLLVAAKRAEDGDDLVLRFWEVAGRATRFTAMVDGRAHALEIAGHALTTVRIARDGRATATDLLERPAAQRP